MAVETLLISGVAGTAIGYAVGKALKIVFHIALVVLGLFALALMFLSYKGWIDVKWAIVSHQVQTGLYNASHLAMQAINDTATKMAAHPAVATVGANSGIPVALVVGFLPGIYLGLRH